MIRRFLNPARPLRRAFSLAATLILLAAAPACAEINIAQTIEWMAADSEVVVLGTISDAQPAREGNHDWTRFRVEVARTFKGEEAASRTFYATGGSQRDLAKGVEAVFFLSRGARIDKPGWPVPWKNDLVVPESSQRVLRLDKHLAYDIEFNVLKSRQEILRAVEAAGRYPEAGTISVWVDVPFGTAAGKALYAGSSCYLIMPVDPRWRDLAERRMDLIELVDSLRWRSAGEMAPSPRDIAFLRSLLGHERWIFQRSGRWPSNLERSLTRVYPLRRVGAELLRGAGIDPGPVTISEPQPRRKPLSPWLWLIPGGWLALSIVAAIRARTVGRVLTLAAMLSLGVWLATLAVWHVQRTRWANLLFHTRGAAHEISCSEGWLSYLKVEGHEPIATTWASTAHPARPEHLKLLPINPGPRWGWNSQRGMTTPFTAVASPFLLLQASFAWPIALSGLLPALWLSLWASRVMRRRRRLRSGRCVHCGYDLRASGDRCPECGAARAGTLS